MNVIVTSSWSHSYCMLRFIYSTFSCRFVNKIIVLSYCLKWHLFYL